MPFPLAHPAVVLPFRKWRSFSFAGLVIGSLMPDVGNSLNIDPFSHSALGSVLLCVPLGLFVYFVFIRVREPLALSLPNPHRQALLRFCTREQVPFSILVGSIALGVWLHLGWDLFTHDHSSLARQLGSVTLPFPGGAKEAPMNKIIWLASTVGGMAALVWAYVSFLRRSGQALWDGRSEERRRYRAWLIFFAIIAGASIYLTWHFYRSADFSSALLVRCVVEFFYSLMFPALGIWGAFLKWRKQPVV